MSRFVFLFLLFIHLPGWSQPLLMKLDSFPEYKKVMLLSAVLPGSGQIYNSIHRENGPKHAFWKVHLFMLDLEQAVIF